MSASKGRVDDSGGGFWARFAVLTVVVLWVSLVGGNWLGKYLMSTRKEFIVSAEQDYRSMPDQRSRLRGRPPVENVKPAPTPSDADASDADNASTDNPSAESEASHVTPAAKPSKDVNEERGAPTSQQTPSGTGAKKPEATAMNHAAAEGSAAPSKPKEPPTSPTRAAARPSAAHATPAVSHLKSEPAPKSAAETKHPTSPPVPTPERPPQDRPAPLPTGTDSTDGDG